MRDRPHNPARMNHVPPETLRRFVDGNASREEVRSVVRHLLSGCRECGSALGDMVGFEQATPPCDEQAYDEVFRRCLEPDKKES